MIPDRDHFGVQYDPSNAIVAGDDPIALLRAVADRVVSMHASDRYLAEGATLDDLRQTDGTLGYSPEPPPRRHRQGTQRLPRHLPHPGRAPLPRLDQHRGRHERHGRNGRVARLPQDAWPQSTFPIEANRWTACVPLSWAAARSARSTPRPWPACPSQSSSPSATPTPSGPHRSRLASKFGPYDDLTRMLSESRVDVLCIATPHPLHAGAAIAAAQAGAHVLVEKPLAASLADCDAMLAAARLHKTKLGVISQRRWYEPVLRMKDAIDAGKIGRPVLGAFTMYSWRDPPITSPTPGAAAGIPRAAAFSSTSRPTCSTCCNGSWTTPSPKSAATGPT